MNEFDEALSALKKELDNNDIVQEYLRLKEIYENDGELKNMRSEIARLASEGKIEQKESLSNIYNSHPVVINYHQAREELVALLKEIKDILSD